MFNQINSRSIPSFDELVFEQRNQAYGAFALRRSYEKHILGGFAITVSFVLLITGAAFIRSMNRDIPATVEKEVILEIVNPILDLPDEPKEPANTNKEIIPPASADKVDTDFVPIASVDSLNIKPTKQPDSVSTAAAGPKTGGSEILAGKPGKGPENLGGETAGGKGTATSTDFPDIWPSFPGGEDAMFNFLRRNLRYPRGEERQGTVYAAFVINVDGSIGDITILSGLSENFDTEVSRVIRKMPVWKPGTQGGQNVAVRYKLPVKFTLHN